MLLLVLLCASATVVSADPRAYIHQGHIQTDQLLPPVASQSILVPGQPYTFEVSLENTQHEDYMIESCQADGVEFIKDYGCLHCDNTFLQVYETDRYTVPGAMKRTLVHFIASRPTMHFECSVRVLACCGCAERSCERRGIAGLYSSSRLCALVVTAGAGAVGGVIRSPSAVAASNGFPWWWWLLIGLLLLLLLLCCLAALLWLCCRKRKAKTVVKTSERGIVTDTFKTPQGSTLSVNAANGNVSHAVLATSTSEKDAVGFGTQTSYQSGYRNGAYRSQHDSLDEYSGGRVTYQQRQHPQKVHVDEVIKYEEEERVYERGDRPSTHFTGRMHRDGSLPRYGRHHSDAGYELGRVDMIGGFDQVEQTDREVEEDMFDRIERDTTTTHTTRFVEETRDVAPPASSTHRARFASIIV